VPRDNLHLTLAFLGEVAEERLEPIVDALRLAVAGTAPFDAALAETGAFPSPRRARVLWAGLAATQLGGIADAVAGGLEPLGFPREARRWTAHVTVARLRSPADTTGLPPAHLPPLSFRVSELTLFRSRLQRPSPRYEPVARVPFGG
jgi:2'-5' RNA ligase